MILLEEFLTRSFQAATRQENIVTVLLFWELVGGVPLGKWLSEDWRMSVFWQGSSFHIDAPKEKQLQSRTELAHHFMTDQCLYKLHHAHTYNTSKWKLVFFVVSASCSLVSWTLTLQACSRRCVCACLPVCISVKSLSQISELWA